MDDFFMRRPNWYFDRQGNPIDMERWGELHADMDYKRVALDVYPALEDGCGSPAG
jgi:hypothetical protein